MMYRLFIVVCALCGFVSCKGQEPVMVRFGGDAQGTYYAVTYYCADGRSWQEEIETLLHDFDRIASLWDTTSQISRLNRGEDVNLSPVFIDLYKKARSICVLTEGAFDFTVGPLVRAYGFWNRAQEEITEEKVAAYKALVDYRKVHLKGDHLLKDMPDMRLDLNAIAQGYSVDLVGDFLASKGIKNYLIDVGGEVLAKGSKPNQRPWVVGIERPSPEADSDRQIQASLSVTNKAVVSSGTYRKFYVKDGKRYSHMIDPRTGKPVDHDLLSVTVVDNETWRADALATAFMVLGVEKAIALLDTLQEDIQVYFIRADNSMEIWPRP